jgi:hypothetical protein
MPPRATLQMGGGLQVTSHHGPRDRFELWKVLGDVRIKLIQSNLIGPKIVAKGPP